MRQVLALVFVFGLGGVSGWLGADSQRPRAPDYPTRIEIQKPGPSVPGKLSAYYTLQVVSANEDGWPVALGAGREGQPSWKIKITGGDKPMTLFAQEE
jgi:hypothetical protein